MSNAADRSQQTSSRCSTHHKHRTIMNSMGDSQHAPLVLIHAYNDVRQVVQLRGVMQPLLSLLTDDWSHVVAIASTCTRWHKWVKQLKDCCRRHLDVQL